MFANNYSDTCIRRSKIRYWIWCIAIKCLIELPCVSTDCHGVESIQGIYPDGPIRVLYGDPLEIFCVTERDSAEDLDFIRDGEVLESEMVYVTTRRLFIQKPERQISTYYCRNKRTERTCVGRVLVDSPPMDVTDFNCISRNLDMLNCSWTNPVTYTILNYTLTYVLDGRHLTPPCIPQKEFGVYKSYCTYTASKIPRYRQLEDIQQFILTGCNIFGCNTQNFTINHYSIVKPDPPSHLKVINTGPHSVQLKWRVSHNLVDLLPCGVEHIIEYQIPKLHNNSYIRENSSGLHSRSAIYTFEIGDLPYAHMQYEVRISVKSKKSVHQKYWSDFSTITFYTASERPQSPPKTVAGAFDQGIFGEKRIVNVYWKQLQEFEESGENFTYKVLLTQGNKSFPIVYPNKTKSLSYVTIREVPFEAVDVNIWSVNANGSSLISSHLYIPAYKDTESLVVPSFTTVYHDEGFYELLLSEIENVDNYTLFWCRHNISKICSDHINFTVLNANNKCHLIYLPTDYRYQFAISANKDKMSSGMVWSTVTDVLNRFGIYEYPNRSTYETAHNSSVCSSLKNY